VSPLAALGAIVAGLSTATFGSVGPIYAIAVGLDLSQIALFLVVSTIGGMISQYPAGLLADRLSRRSVLLVFSIMASALCLAMMLPVTDLRLFGIPLVYVMSFLFGLTTFPIYSICAAHASDFVQNDKMISLSASLIFLYASGAIVSPLIAGWIIEHYGAPMMFSLISAAHVTLMFYTIYSNSSRPAETRRRYAYIPRTSLFIASILRPRRGNGRRKGGG